MITLYKVIVLKKFDLMASITGFFMAMADAVPGVSGGTIAYILGKYDQLISSINLLSSTHSSLADKTTAIKFLGQLMLGWILGFVIAILAITSIINAHIYNLSSLFLGFMAFAIPYTLIEEKQVIKNHYQNIIFMVIGILVVFMTSYFSKSAINLWSNDLTLGVYIFIFLSGLIAISAMLLPGISGSTILVIFGMYLPIITAIKELLHFNFSSFWVVFVFGLGVLFGLKFSTKMISISLEKYRSITVYTIIGLMIGSIYSIIIGPSSLVDEATGQSLNLANLSWATFNIKIFILGITLVAGLDYLKKYLENK